MNNPKLPRFTSQAFSRRRLMAEANPVTISCVIQGLICADSLVLCEGVGAWDLSHQLVPAWSNCLLPPPPSPGKLTNGPPPAITANQNESGLLWTTAATAGMIIVPLNPKKMSWPQGRKKINCTTKEVQTDLSRKWSSTVNKNYNVSTIRPQLPRHCYLSLLSTSSSTTRTDLLQWSASELSWWSTAGLSVTFHVLYVDISLSFETSRSNLFVWISNRTFSGCSHASGWFHVREQSGKKNKQPCWISTIKCEKLWSLSFLSSHRSINSKEGCHRG